MKGNIQISSKLCKKCKKRMKFERNSMIWGCGDIIMVLLGAFIGLYLKSALAIVVGVGFWIGARFIINESTNPWRCKECGSKPYKRKRKKTEKKSDSSD